MSPWAKHKTDPEFEGTPQVRMDLHDLAIAFKARSEEIQTTGRKTLAKVARPEFQVRRTRSKGLQGVARQKRRSSLLKNRLNLGDLQRVNPVKGVVVCAALAAMPLVWVYRKAGDSKVIREESDTDLNRNLKAL
mmetsp:Transcript_8831/g.23956  ORF Transcript_8831/g.23956 Transcript_8831/m.23956 type:complete len:134 (-) Transcript_8831:80-481(-)